MWLPGMWKWLNFCESRKESTLKKEAESKLRAFNFLRRWKHFH